MTFMQTWTRSYVLVLLLLPPLVGASSILDRETTTPVVVDPGSNNNDVNFVDWISNAPDEITEWKTLQVHGTIPSYVHGTFVRNGPGIWSKGDKTFSHIFDGLAKISAYRIHKDGRVEYKNQFIQSDFYQKVQRKGSIPRVFSVGPLLSRRNDMQPRTGTKAVLQAIQNSLNYDNACVNIWNYDPSNRQSDLQALTDTPARAGLNHKDFSTLWSSSKAPKPLTGVFGFEFTETAHPLYSLTSNDTYNVAICLTPRGSQLALVKEAPTGCRTVVSKVTVGGAPYLHSFGLTDRHAVIVVPPQRINLRNLPAFLQKGMLRSLVDVNSTTVVVFDLTTCECVLEQEIDEKIYFFHTVSTATTKNDNGEETVSIRLCAYHTNDVLSGEDQFIRLERCQSSKEARNRITRGGTFCDVVCNLQTKHVGVQWRPIEYGQGFELPVTRYSRTFGPDASFVSKQHPQFVYAYGTYALGSDQYDSWALFKFEPEKGTIAGVFRRESVYVSEPAFIANPDGSSEDDGVLLSQVYDGKRQETGLLVLDAKTMKVLAEAWTGNRSPMDFHGGWFPAAKDE